MASFRSLSLQSFHFSPRLPGKDWASSEAAHESRLAALLRLGPGKKCLDVGCGVGGPMRTIASTSGAEVTGITINDYQVSRAKHHNEKVRSLRARQPDSQATAKSHFRSIQPAVRQGRCTL